MRLHMYSAVPYEPKPMTRWTWNALIPFLLTSIMWMTRNQSRSGLFVFSKIVPTKTQNR